MNAKEAWEEWKKEFIEDDLTGKTTESDFNNEISEMRAFDLFAKGFKLGLHSVTETEKK